MHSKANLSLFAITFILLSSLLSLSQACKCVDSGNNVIEITQTCCFGDLDAAGDDCSADSISEQLSSFAACCETVGLASDCRA